MKLDRNLIAGVVNSLWTAALGIAVVPIYLKYLGMEAYGLIAFFASAQTLLQLLDMGLIPTMNREMARCTAMNQLDEARGLLHSLSIVYWLSALILGIAIAALAPVISTNWLHASATSHSSVTNALLLMAIVFACRWPIGLYQGAIIGAQKAALTSVINIGMVSLSTLGAVTLLEFFAPKIETYFAWQAVVGIAYALTMRRAAWSVVGHAHRKSFDLRALRRVWRFSAGMTGVALSGTILMQLDKVILSRLLSLEAFGAYALAATLSSGLYVLLSPTFNVVYPRLSAMVASGDTSNLTSYYRVGTRLLLAFLFPFAALISSYSTAVLLLWTHNPSAAADASPIVAIFILGTALNGAMHFPYALQLAYGLTKIPLTINAILLIITVPTTILLAYSYGATGGALSWAVINVLYVAVGTWLTHKTLLKGIALEWLAFDVGVPLMLSVLIVGGTSLIAHRYTKQIDILIGSGVLSCAVATALVIAASAETRALVFKLIRNQPTRMRTV